MSDRRRLELVNQYGPDVAELYDLSVRICRERGHDVYAVEIGGNDAFECGRCKEKWVPMGTGL